MTSQWEQIAPGAWRLSTGVEAEIVDPVDEPCLCDTGLTCLARHVDDEEEL